MEIMESHGKSWKFVGKSWEIIVWRTSGTMPLRGPALPRLGAMGAIVITSGARLFFF